MLAAAVQVVVLLVVQLVVAAETVGLVQDHQGRPDASAGAAEMVQAGSLDPVEGSHMEACLDRLDRHKGHSH